MTYIIMIHDSTHMNSEDMPFVLPFTRLMGMAGSISPKRMAGIMNDYLLSFFNKHLKGEDAPLLDGPSADYPEFKFEPNSP